MCGIVGYTGTRPVKDILIEGLSRLEYRGYDSAGIAVEQDGKLEVVHCKGKVSGLAQLVEPLELTGTCGIGHTRWATHGRPSEANAHPHTSCDGSVAVVHNGIIENFAELREELDVYKRQYLNDSRRPSRIMWLTREGDTPKARAASAAVMRGMVSSPASMATVMIRPP